MINYIMILREQLELNIIEILLKFQLYKINIMNDNNTNEYFFIENDYLMYKKNEKNIKHFFSMNNVNNKDFIIKTLNNNIKNVSIIEKLNENKMIFKINDKEFIKVIYDSNNQLNLYIFNLDNKCNKCNNI